MLPIITIFFPARVFLPTIVVPFFDSRSIDGLFLLLLLLLFLFLVQVSDDTRDVARPVALAGGLIEDQRAGVTAPECSCKINS